MAAVVMVEGWGRRSPALHALVEVRRQAGGHRGDQPPRVDARAIDEIRQVRALLPPPRPATLAEHRVLVIDKGPASPRERCSSAWCAAAKAVSKSATRRAFSGGLWRSMRSMAPAVFPDRVRMSLEGLRHDLTCLRRDCAAGGPLDTVIVALGQTIRHFFDAVERFDLTTLRCDSGDRDWRAFEASLRALRKSVGYQISALADSYAVPLQGEFAAYVPQMAAADGY